MPLLIYYNQDGHKWFRRNVKSGNTWSEVGKNHKEIPKNSDKDGNMRKLLQLTGYHPQITPDLSKPYGKSYSGGETGVTITVRNAPLGNGYWKYKHSLRGGLFELKEVKHTEQVPLTYRTYDGKLESITAFYYGTTPTERPNLLLVELVIRRGWNYKRIPILSQRNKGRQGLERIFYT
ncbi:hypothetical protein BEWA_003470 [Theileria equi strain WA]|uniref:Uncharacterized protein n=1 Tax=Theileria equi strain WA TaxID=1537102 RepID=L0B1F6_THEEQ|nr:hypothetical protein BEWA_003470 [Theileria equi strain WA]AFZ80939.1 hypothetical protein BEWA_003470 [Theileria equi strain WA]|eukprot:XP_004830605.1 hypothetical protein BEWA_003470 [Theileria equi strain WA]